MAGRSRLLVFGLAVLALASLALAGDATAQTDLPNATRSFNGLLELIQQSAAQWDGRLRNYAIRLFWLLAAIQFIYTFFPLVFRQADIGETMGELVRFVLVIGFFLALLTSSREWAGAIVDSFRQAGASAGGLGTKMLTAGDIFSVAVEFAVTVGNTHTWNPLTAVTVSLAGLVVLLCFAFIAAFMALTVIESYVVINAAVLFMGFGGSQWTRDYAIATMRYAVSVGAKLFVLTLLVGLMISSAKTWQAAYNSGQSDASMWTMVGLSLACAYLTKSVPDLVQGMITGSSMGGGHGIGAMAMAVAAVATGGAGALAAGGAAGASGAAGGAGGAAAGASGAAGGATGGGGLAGLLNSSLGAGRAAGAAGNAPSSHAAIPSRTGGGGTPVAKAASGGSSAPGGTMTAAVQPSQDGEGQQAGAPAAANASEPAGAAKAQPDAAASAGNNPASGPAAEPAAGSQGGRSGWSTAEGAVRTMGVLSAIAVPGMESAGALSLDSGRPPKLAADAPPDRSDFAGKDAGTANIIRPATPAEMPPATPGSAPAASSPSGATKPREDPTS